VQPEVDPRRVVLVGRSFGGLIAPRGAAGERKLADAAFNWLGAVLAG
jgi:dienelactone hydrolase